MRPARAKDDAARILDCIHPIPICTFYVPPVVKLQFLASAVVVIPQLILCRIG